MCMQIWRRVTGVSLVAGLCFMLAACFLTPGRFASSLDIRRDGSFSFSYTGEIRMLALSRLAEQAGKEKAAKDLAPFQPACFQADGAKSRACSPDEVAEQRQNHLAKNSAASAKSQRDAEMMKQVLGGLDPTNPKSAEEFAARLRKQAGWRRVDYKGDGLFVVDFAISGRLDHDLTFPMIERFPAANAFVVAYRHADGSVRVEAPAFSGSANGGPMMAMMQAGMVGGMTGASGPDSSAKGKSVDAAPPLPLMDGRFILTTDARILANNTDDGPQPDTHGSKLEWIVDSRSQNAPTALLQLGQR